MWHFTVLGHFSTLSYFCHCMAFCIVQLNRVELVFWFSEMSKLLLSLREWLCLLKLRLRAFLEIFATEVLLWVKHFREIETITFERDDFWANGLNWHQFWRNNRGDSYKEIQPFSSLTFHGIILASSVR